MPETQSGIPPQHPSRSSTPWRVRLLALLPFVLTSLVSIVISLGIQTFVMESREPNSRQEHMSSSIRSVPSQVALQGTSVHTRPLVPTGTPRLVIPSDTPQPTHPSYAALFPTQHVTVSPSPHPQSDMAMTATVETAQQMDELQVELQKLWSAYYLARAASQLADAEAALRVNDLAEVEQIFVTVGISLDFAYERSSEQLKGPISDFRLQVGKMHEDVYVRPEHMDVRVRRLRQSMLSLVDEEQ